MIVCKECRVETAPRTPTWMAGGPAPDEMGTCPQCKSVWASFEITGENPFLVNLSRKPRDMGISDYVEECFERRNAN